MKPGPFAKSMFDNLTKLIPLLTVRDLPNAGGENSSPEIEYALESSKVEFNDAKNDLNLMN